MRNYIIVVSVLFALFSLYNQLNLVAQPTQPIVPGTCDQDKPGEACLPRNACCHEKLTGNFACTLEYFPVICDGKEYSNCCMACVDGKKVCTQKE